MVDVVRFHDHRQDFDPLMLGFWIFGLLDYSITEIRSVAILARDISQFVLGISLFRFFAVVMMSKQRTGVAPKAARVESAPKRKEQEHDQDCWGCTEIVHVSRIQPIQELFFRCVFDTNVSVIKKRQNVITMVEDTSEAEDGVFAKSVTTRWVVSFS